MVTVMMMMMMSLSHTHRQSILEMLTTSVIANLLCDKKLEWYKHMLHTMYLSPD